MNEPTKELQPCPITDCPQNNIGGCELSVIYSESKPLMLPQNCYHKKFKERKTK